MVPSAELLWRLNNEYRKRLSRVGNYLDLLERLLMPLESADEYMLEALRHAQEQVARMTSDHRDWRYNYFYESNETKRMVQSEREVGRALSTFSRMRAQHEQTLAQLYTLLESLQRPDPHLTNLPTGDLWAQTVFALSDLAQFVNDPAGAV